MELHFERVRLWLVQLVRGALFWKYVVLIGAVMGSALVLSNLVDIWFTARDHRAALVRLQQEQAGAAAARITQFVKEIEGQLGWMTQLSWAASTAEQRELDALRLLRQVPAINELVLIDGQGRERLRVSRQAMDRIESHADRSQDDSVKGALANKVYYGPVVFQKGSEPVMTLAVSGARQDAGVAVALVNLTLIWDVVHSIRVGRQGRAYVVGPAGRLIAHPDISLVLRNTDMTALAHVQAALSADPGRSGVFQRAVNLEGKNVLNAHARASPLDWVVFVELPETEADEPLYATVKRSIFIGIAGLFFTCLAALLLASRMVVPIQALAHGAARIGAGALDHRIDISTGDELEALGAQFNDMAVRLEASYSTLERKVGERTRELQAANLSKSRFLAVASHDLRQPLHALNLLVAQLRSEPDRNERDRLAALVGTTVANINELFNALLDISKLEAGALSPSISAFRAGSVLARIEAHFGPAARDKGLHFAVVPSSQWVSSDPILLERILINLVSNAVRYTSQGGIVVGCRAHCGRLRIDVCDTGVGIPAEQQGSIFTEFYRGSSSSMAGEGLGLGLAIVERLCALLGHPIELVSAPGKGSRFSITLPLAQPAADDIEPARAAAPGRDPLAHRLCVVIDDDELILEATSRLFRSWGCDVVAVASPQAALLELDGRRPDLIVSDYRLRHGGNGLDAIGAIRAAAGLEVPAFIVSGDLAAELDATVRGHDMQLLHKPLSPMALRAMATRLVAGVSTQST